MAKLTWLGLPSISGACGLTRITGARKSNAIRCVKSGSPGARHVLLVKNARMRMAVNLKRLRAERGPGQESVAALADPHHRRTCVSRLGWCVTNISIDGLERIASEGFLYQNGDALAQGVWIQEF